jgi:hypothetical protein
MGRFISDMKNAQCFFAAQNDARGAQRKYRALAYVRSWMNSGNRWRTLEMGC